MIGRITGKLIEKQPPQLLVDINGIGYEVEAPMSTFYKLPATGNTVVLLTHLVVREDAHLLYGFSSHNERDLFRTLIKISGVGAKMALTILSGVSTEEFISYVQHGDIASLTRLPGVGKKTAERLIVEMRDKLGSLETLGDVTASLPADPETPEASPVEQAVKALISLGYKPTEASKMVRAAALEATETEEIIRLSLKSSLNRR
ncbi:MAG TPA: Holliday junction branch migration protein RuvA [Gammaproteobacteria bacterium]|nr:Holliday junction branch migration protein RuvA [Gammaproteobacteria bacterium]